MYVLASLSIVDDFLDHVTIYRDLMGEKHLWYYSDQKVFLCSTTPGLIVSYLNRTSDISLNYDYIYDYFEYRHAIDPFKHFIKGVNQLPPGSRLFYRCSSNHVSITAHQSIEELIDPVLLTERNTAKITGIVSKRLNSALEAMEGVNRSHIDSAAILSGGVDSSLVSAYLGKIRPLGRTYTLCFEGKETVSFLSKDMAASINLPNTQINVSVEEYYHSLITCMRHLGSPINTHSMPSSLLLSQHVRREGHQIIYGGEGADELFMGYSTYSDSTTRLSDYSGDIHSIPLRTTRTKSTPLLSSYIRDRYSHFFKTFSELGLDDLSAVAKSKSLVDTEIQLPSVGLLSSDTVTSISGIEGRTPFTRREVSSIGLSLHPDMLIRPTNSQKCSLKYPLSELFNQVFTEIFNYPKEGYAGYPNECQIYLGPPKDWQILSLLEICPETVSTLSRAQMWKLINLEIFLSQVLATI
ncbi:asparagine synthase-related protein [Synechococcus sp. BS55D]|uniref:asparagine synthase-related protein n=1 Tax=Synechococcus sp. BS55D TaxID=2055943 RepID=UPI001375D39B|nr:asparagine synthase C-terminal domain-containing protein [Synechococcus sp. BS55D]